MEKVICKKCKYITYIRIIERCKNKNNIKIHESWFDYVNGIQHPKHKEYSPCFLKNPNGECPYFEEKESTTEKINNFIKKFCR